MCTVHNSCMSWVRVDGLVDINQSRVNTTAQSLNGVKMRGQVKLAWGTSMPRCRRPTARGAVKLAEHQQNEAQETLLNEGEELSCSVWPQ